MHLRFLLTTLLVTASTAPLAAQTSPDEPAVVFALDTSRSLTPAALAAAGQTLSRVVETLPSDLEIGVLVFADEPRWLVEPGVDRARVAEALRGVTPEGQFTLLNDALYLAARRLEEGGVVVLVSDGRDENSATTEEDVGRRYEADGIRIHSLGFGRRIEDRALRRLALLTGGRFLGRLDEIEPTTVSGEVAAAIEEVRAEAAAAHAAAVATADSVAPAPGPVGATDAEPVARGGLEGATSEAPSPTRGLPGWLLPLALLVAIATGTTVWLLRRRSSTTRPEAYCTRCGSELDPEAPSCPHCAIEDLHRRLADRPAYSPAEAKEVKTAPKFSLSDTNPGILETTRVLLDQNLLVVREPGERPRSFLLRPERAFAVGRDPTGNTIAIPDPALSARHFMIVPDTDSFYLVDLTSTNGSFVNGRRVRAQRLDSGDVIQAGQVRFEFESQQQALN